VKIDVARCIEQLMAKLPKYGAATRLSRTTESGIRGDLAMITHESATSEAVVSENLQMTGSATRLVRPESTFSGETP
jgi:hypothetical protein